jgi:hypothetical protein
MKDWRLDDAEREEKGNENNKEVGTRSSTFLSECKWQLAMRGFVKGCWKAE